MTAQTTLGQTFTATTAVVDTTAGQHTLEAPLLESIRAEVAAERLSRWQADLADGRSPRLNPELPAPAPDHSLWLGTLGITSSVQEPTGKEMSAFLERNELGDAELFQHFHRLDYVYNHGIEKWLRFGGVVWELDTVRCAVRAAMELAERYAETGRKAYAWFAEQRANVEVDISALTARMTALEVNSGEDAEADAAQDTKEEKKRLKSEIIDLEAQSLSLLRKGRKVKRDFDERARALRGIRRVKQVLEVSASGEGSQGRTGKEFDLHPTLMPFANGVVDLETGRILRRAPELYLMRTSPCEYPGLHAECPWWDEHLRKVFCDDDELLDYFELCIGHSALGLQLNKDIYVALGPLANNGKSITFNALREVMGDMAATLKNSVILEDKKSGSGPDPELMVMDGVRMCIASETGRGCHFSMERIKAVTGGDEVRGRELYAASKVINTNGKLWLHTNDVPSIRGYDPGFILRLRIIPFEAQFVDAEEVNESVHKYLGVNKEIVKKKIESIKPFIAAWIVRCARRALNNRNFKAPERVKQYTKSYFEDNDVVGNFVEACCTTSPELRCKSRELWNAFEYWCVREQSINRKYVQSNISFTRDLEKRGSFARVQKRPHTVWGGLALTPEWAGRELD